MDEPKRTMCEECGERIARYVGVGAKLLCQDCMYRQIHKDRGSDKSDRED